MRGVNKVTLLGNVGRDPEVRTSQAGTAVAKFSLATADRRKDARGEWMDATEWHNLVAFGRTAEIIRDYVRKGSQLYLEGKLQTQSWEDKDTGAKRYRTEIVVQELTLLGGKPGGRVSDDGAETRSYEYSAVTDEDVPF